MYPALAIGLSLLVYSPILRNYFFLDDFLILNLLVNRPLVDFLTMHWAGHLVATRQAFYAAVHALAGMNPTPYFAVVLMLHAVNVGLVFAIVRRVTRSAPLACLAAVAWGTCPVNEGALGWLAASGNVVVATVALGVTNLAYAEYGRGTAAMISPRRTTLWSLALLLGAQAFGTGLAVAIALPPLLVWLAWERLTRAACLVLLTVPLLTAAMYGNEQHEFTATLPSSLAARASMLAHLHTIGVARLLQGLAHEPGRAEILSWPVFGKDAALYDLGVLPYLLALLVTLLWLVAIWRASGQTRRLLIVLAALVLSQYAVIAIARAYFLDTFHQPVVMQTGQSRYHYAATALLAVGIAIALASVFPQRLDTWASVALAAWLAVAAVLYWRSDWVIWHHDEERADAERIMARIDRVIQETPPGQPVVTYNEPFGYRIYGAASLYVMSGRKQSVYFVDKNAANIHRAFPGSPLAAHVVAEASHVAPGNDEACCF